MRREVSIRKNLAEVFNWFVSRENRFLRWYVTTFAVLWMVGCVLSVTWSPLRSMLERHGLHDPSTSAGEALLGSLVWALLLCSVVANVHLKARLIRLDKRLSIEHARFYQAKVERLYAAKELKLLADRAKWERERDEWQAKKQNELYEIIIEQVERGIVGPRSELNGDD